MNRQERIVQETKGNNSSLSEILLADKNIGPYLTDSSIILVEEDIAPGIKKINYRYPDDTEATTPLFGSRQARGIYVIKNTIDPLELLKTFPADTQRYYPVVVEQEIPHWLSFYEQIVRQGTFSLIGQKSLVEFSGLDRTTPVAHDGLRLSLRNLYKAEKKAFDSRGIEVVKSSDVGTYSCDFLFVKKKLGTIAPVKLYNTQRAYLDNEILVRTVHLNDTPIAGIVLRQAGETKRDAWFRAWTAEEELKKEGISAHIMVWSEGQASLITKLGGMTRALCATDPKAEEELSLRDVYKTLYFGISPLEPGFLATRNLPLSLPRLHKEHGIDILFESKNERDERVNVVLDNLISLNIGELKKTKGSEGKYFPLSSVVGIIIVPENTDPSEMKRRADIAAKRIVRYREVRRLSESINGNNHNGNGHNGNGHNGNGAVHEDSPRVLVLTRSLFNEWVRRNTMFFPKEEKEQILRESPVEKVLEYGNPIPRYEIPESRTLYERAKLSDVTFTLIWRGPTIGDKQVLVTEHYNDGTKRVHTSDFGAVYKDIPKGFKGMTERSGIKMFLRDGIIRGELPMVPGIYVLPYLLGMTRQWPELTNPHPSIAARYVRSEIVHRSNLEVVSNIIGADRARRLFDYGKIDEELFYKGKDSVPGMALLTHGHNDHTGNAQYLDMPYGGIWQTIAYLQSLSNNAQMSVDRFTEISRTDLVSRGPYPTESRDLFSVYEMGGELKVSENIIARFFFVNHSMEAAAILWMTPFGNMLDMGDIKPGPWTSQSVQELSKYPIHAILCEATNERGSAKTSIGITDEIIYENIIRALSTYNAKRSFSFIRTIPNSLNRIELLNQAVHDPRVKKELLVNFRMADYIEIMRNTKQGIPSYSFGYDVFTPRIGDEVGLYKHQIDPRPWQENLVLQAKSGRIGVYDIWDINEREKGNAVVGLITAYDKIQSYFEGADLGHVVGIHSAPDLYDYPSRVKGATIQWFADRKEGEFIAGFDIVGGGWRTVPHDDISNRYHVGGHGSYEQIMEILQQIITNNEVWKSGATIDVYFQHGKHTGSYTEAAKADFAQWGIGGVEFHGSHSHYDPTNPLERPGEVIRFRK